MWLWCITLIIVRWIVITAFRVVVLLRWLWTVELSGVIKWITLIVILESCSIVFQKSEFLLFTPFKGLLAFFLIFRDSV